MNRSTFDDLRPMGTGSASITAVSAATGVSWGAIFAGAVAAAALSLILLMLGVGLGLSSVSPWSGAGVSAEAFGVGTVLWLVFTQLAASGMGGYLAGRLRLRWLAVDTDEVYFRDTAHGFLAWGVASLMTAALLTSAIGAIVSGGVQAGAAALPAAASMATSVAASAGGGGQSSSASTQAATSYFVDSLFRNDTAAAASAAAASTNPDSGTTAPGGTPTASAPAALPTAEVARIFASGLRGGAALPNEDLRYVAQLVSQRTGMANADSQKRVTDAYSRLQTQLRDAETQARDAADRARKASAHAALWIFISLLAGAFCASFTATLGGRQRDL